MVSAVNLKVVLPLVFIGCAISAMGQSGNRQHRRDIELETPATDSWRPVPPLRSPGMYSAFGDSVAIQVNVDGSGQNIVGDAANEPSIVVDPNNPNRIAIGWRQFNSISSNFRQSGYGYSADGGATWTFPGVLENNVFRSDPVLVPDEAGNFIYNSLLQSFYDDTWKSTNGGQSYLRNASPVNTTGGDKQWMTIDRTNSTGRGFMYQIWSTAGNNWGGRQFSRSTDGGLNWMNPINMPNQPIWGVPDYDANGNVFVAGSDGGSNFYLLRSSNAKNSAVTPTFDQNVAVNLGGSMGFSVTVNPDGLAGQVWMAVDRSTGPNRGNIYMLSSLRVNATNPCDIRFARSTNGGTSFQSAIRINKDAQNQTRWHWFGCLSLAPNGRIDVTWLDTRADSTNNTSQLYRSYSLDGGVTWSADEPLTNSFNEHLGYPQQNKIGDYLTTVSDNTGCDIAFSATFNGEQDIYFMRVAAPNPSYSIIPDVFTVNQGVQSGGNLASLAQHDANRLLVQADELDPAPQVTVEGTSPYGTVSEINFQNWSSASRTDMVEKVELWNWTLNAGVGGWDPSASWARTTTIADTLFTHTISAGATVYVSPSTKKVRTRLTQTPLTDRSDFDGWGLRLDQTVWSITP